MNKQKIVITGALGYVGLELTSLFFNNFDFSVIAIDNRRDLFLEKIFKENKINYFNREIFNIKDLINNADVIYHLASITNVPKTQQEETEELERQIMKIGVDGTRYILENCKKTCKVIFASTHVVFEGLVDNLNFIDEIRKPKPILSYSRSKFISENDIINSGINFIISRFASVYGYNYSIRKDIVANFFALKASRSEEIKLFSGGLNIKPLIGVSDLSRVLYMFSNDIYLNDIYHLVNENVTVKTIANICKKYNENVNLTVSNDIISNVGYSLSNKKLLSIGFRFKQDLDTEIKLIMEKFIGFN